MAQSVIYRPERHSAGPMVIDIQEKFRSVIASFDAVIAGTVKLPRTADAPFFKETQKLVK
jgi:hypothetical protein